MHELTLLYEAGRRRVIVMAPERFRIIPNVAVSSSASFALRVTRENLLDGHETHSCQESHECP